MVLSLLVSIFYLLFRFHSSILDSIVRYLADVLPWVVYCLKFSINWSSPCSSRYLLRVCLHIGLLLVDSMLCSVCHAIFCLLLSCLIQCHLVHLWQISIGAAVWFTELHGTCRSIEWISSSDLCGNLCRYR